MDHHDRPVAKVDDRLERHLGALHECVAVYLAAATDASGEQMLVQGQLDHTLAHRHQRLLHGVAWMNTTAQAVLCLARWGQHLAQESRLGDGERLLIGIGIGEYLEQLSGAIPMSQNEIFRPAELGLAGAAAVLRAQTSAAWFLANGNTAEARCALIASLRAGALMDEALPDAELNMVREQFRRFSQQRIAPHAQA